MFDDGHEWQGEGGVGGGGARAPQQAAPVYQSETADELEAHLNKGPDVPTNELTD